MPAQSARSVALIWFAGVAAIMIALVGAVTLTAEATPTPSPTLFPTFTHTPAPRTGTPARPTRTHTPRPRGTLTSSPTFTATPSPAYLQCAWQWARQPVPEITQQAQDFFIKAEFSVGIWVETYGENCIDYRAGTPTVAYFAAMTTDFYLNIYSTNLSDARSLAESYVKAYQLLVEFSAEADLPARAHAAFEGRTWLENRDILMAAELALPHRLKRGPFADGQMNMANVEQQLEQASTEWGQGEEASESADGSEENAVKKKANR